MKKTFAYMMALPIILALNGCYNDAEYTNFVNSDKIKSLPQPQLWLILLKK